MDFLWRARAARIVAESRPRKILDLASGSGDLAIALRKASPSAAVVGADFCLPMLEMARRKTTLPLVQADGLRLPFRDAIFDALTVAFGLRNMASWEGALQEMARVLRPGGLVAIMDFSLPGHRLLQAPYRLYLHRVLPRLAALVTGNRDAYEYLGESIEAFPREEKMLQLIEGCGFEQAYAIPLSFGVAAIYVAVRSGKEEENVKEYEQEKDSRRASI